MITGRWGSAARTLLELTVDDHGVVTGIVNPGRERAPIRRGSFDKASGALLLEGEISLAGESSAPYVITGKLEGRKLALSYQIGDHTGEVTAGHVEEYRPDPLTIWQRIEPHIAAVKRRMTALTRPNRVRNREKLKQRGGSIDSIVFRDATAADIPALAELHVTTWNATYNTTRGPTVATRTSQWNKVFEKRDRRDFVLVLENSERRLIGFAWGKPHHGDDRFEGELSKMYLRWEYHGLGLGRRMMEHITQRFRERGIRSFLLFAELSNPTIGFYDRMGGERLVDEHGRFTGAFGWSRE